MAEADRSPSLVPLNGVRRLQRELAATGWDPRDIARVLRARYPQLSMLAALRYGHGWSSEQAVDRIKAEHRRPPGSRCDRPAALDVTRLNEWEHWPRSGVRAGLLYQEASSWAYQVPICELGLSEGCGGHPPHAGGNAADDVARLAKAMVVVVDENDADATVLQAALDGAAQLVDLVATAPARTGETLLARQTADRLRAWAGKLSTPLGG